MGLRDRLRPKPDQELERDAPGLSFNDYLGLFEQFGFNGNQYTVPASPQEEISPLYSQFARAAYKSDSVVFACLQVRQALFSEARFQFRQIRAGRPGDLFGTPALAVLEEPWPGATTGDLLSMALLHHDLGGNAYIASVAGGLRLLRPDWVTMLIGSESSEQTLVWDSDAEVVGYRYQPGGPGSGRDPELFLAEEVAHFAASKDPEAQFRGMSILTSVIREIMADKAATDHKLKFFENAATPNLHVKLDVPDLATLEAYVKKFREGHEGAHNAYKTLYTAAGADATIIGSNLQQMDFKVTQGAGETRIAAALGVPPVIVGLSEGLAGSSLNAGNFESSMRRFTDVTMRPLWRNIAGSLARIIPVPSNAELWYDDRDIPALQEDVKKAGERLLAWAETMNTLITAGYEPDSVTAAVTSGDFTRLVHTGMTSVQLQKPGAPEAPGEPEDGPGETPSESEAPPDKPQNGGGRSADIEKVFSTSVGLENRRLKAELEEKKVELAEKRTLEIHNHLPEHRVSIERGAIQVDNAATPAPDVHVTVEAPPPAEVNVTTPEVRVEMAAPPPAEVNVTVEAAEPAHVDVKVETERLADAVLELAEARKAAKPTEITVNPPEVRFEPQIDVHVPEQRDSVVNVTVPEQPAPVVNITTPDVTVNVPDGPAPVVNVNIDDEPLDATVTFKRDPRSGLLKSADITENPENS